MVTHDHDATDHAAHGGDSSARRLGLVAAINFVGFAVEMAGGILFGSVALVGDALHMLFDSSAYVVALGAVLVARRSDPSGRWSYGLHRVEPFAAFLNGLLLVPMVLFLVWESWRRFQSPVEIDTTFTILLAAGGLLVNLASVYVLQGGEMSLNERGAFYHLLGDAGASVAVILSTAVVATTGILAADPVTAILIAGLIVYSAAILLRESGAIFFQGSPVDTDEVRAALRAVDGVESVEDCHVWSLSSQISVATVFVVDASETLAERDALVDRVHALLEADYGITHSTVEAVSDVHEHEI